MRTPLICLAAALTLAGCASTAPHAPQADAGRNGFLAAAVSDAGRPEADVKRDADRKPVQTLAFAGVRPGDKVADLIPGGGYFTRILSKAVGPDGRVYAYVPAELTKVAKREPTVKAVADDPAYKNVSMILDILPNFGAPEKLDVVFTAQNYHDMHDSFMGPADLAVVNKQVFKALKPGGVFVIIDHVAASGSGLRDTESLHRIDPAAVKAEVTAAGFVFEGESPILRNPTDPHTASVFDPAVRGHSDQFLYKFRKPRTAR